MDQRKVIMKIINYFKRNNNENITLKNFQDPMKAALEVMLWN